VRESLWEFRAKRERGKGKERRRKIGTKQLI
jgi:hypothetical protein